MSTFAIIVLMLSGILIGARFLSAPERVRALAVFGKAQQAATIVLLGAMGLWLGGNEEFWKNLGEIGLTGALFAVVGAGASILLLCLVCKLFFQGGKP